MVLLQSSTSWPRSHADVHSRRRVGDPGAFPKRRVRIDSNLEAFPTKMVLSQSTTSRPRSLDDDNRRSGGYSIALPGKRVCMDSNLDLLPTKMPIVSGGSRPAELSMVVAAPD